MGVLDHVVGGSASSASSVYGFESLLSLFNIFVEEVIE